MEFDYFDKHTFLCEMYDEEADKTTELILNFFPFDNSVQVIDTKRGKKMLKRTQLPSFSPAMLQIGNIVNIFGKLLMLIDSAPATKRTLFKDVESTFVMIKPIPRSAHGKIITFIMNKGFRIVKIRNGKISKDFAMELYSNLGGNKNLPVIVDYITSDEVLGLELAGPRAVQAFRECLGATDPADAAPGTLRALFGENVLRNVAHGVSTPADAAKMIDEFFGVENGNPKIPYRATFEDCTCCILKPHVLIDGNVGAILEHISTSGQFYISAIAMFTVSMSNAKEFYEVYKGVLPEYEAMSLHLAEGNCIVLEVKCNDSKLNCVCEFRKLCGPRDPDVCRQLYPNSIRGLYGKTVIHNAVHCTDLPEDGVTEVEYFFKLLASTTS
ncbi:nucleoside diphosphate kinase 7 [Plutella xylostella]|uniref:nucleoside diphosphate kinase 7 n=1 Tax=Plutella xylostella TaxID=51655 RepID=UPI002032AA43|nr:nucleoside diphosphate kinase 7 [Plutella xylostella]